MACPCCGKTWQCLVCCCPDGKPSPQSIRLQLSNWRVSDVAMKQGQTEYLASRGMGAVTFRDFSVEGAYTLSLTTIPDPLSTFTQGPQDSCVRYVYREGAPSGCPGVVQENDKKLLFVTRFRNQRVYRGSKYVFAFSGVNQQGRCLSFAVVATAGTGYDLCTGDRMQRLPGEPDGVFYAECTVEGRQVAMLFDGEHI